MEGGRARRYGDCGTVEELYRASDPRREAWWPLRLGRDHTHGVSKLVGIEPGGAAPQVGSYGTGAGPLVRLTLRVEPSSGDLSPSQV